tara:strand:- start:2007 stop:2270 length:264 start_codon:yes stop_codon:yes gene_type:complete
MPNIDRSPDEMPTKTMFARMTGYYPSATPRYNSGLTRPLRGAQNTLPEFLQEEILADGKPSKKDAKGSAFARHMKFCGGMSKPYKRK